MVTYPWEEGVLFIGFDPAQRVSAVAWRGRSKESGKVVQGSRLTPDILDALQVERTLRAVGEEIDHQKVWVAIEYPRWNAGASQTVRAAANTYVRLIRRVFPRAEIVKVDPNQWQGFFDFKNRPPGQSTKEFSVWVATRAYGWSISEEHDRADAALILEWLRANPPARKAKPRPKKKKPARPS